MKVAIIFKAGTLFEKVGEEVDDVKAVSPPTATAPYWLLERARENMFINASVVAAVVVKE